MTQKTLTFHIGLYKTASTFLQKSSFGSSKHIAGTANSPHHLTKAVQHSFHQRSPWYWHTDKGLQLIKDLLNHHDLPLIYTGENIYKAKIFNQYPRALLDREKSFFQVEPYTIAEHLKQISQSLSTLDIRTRAFFFFRRQPEWLASMYAQLSNGVRRPSQDDFDKKLDSLLQDPEKHGANTIAYDRIIDCLQSSLGENNVLCAPYENIGDQSLWSRIREFSGITDLNPDFSGDKVNLRRSCHKAWTLNRARPSSTKAVKVVDSAFQKKYASKLFRLFVDPIWNASLPSTSITLHPEKEEAIKDLFRDSNARLEKKTGEDLEVLGYYPSP